MPSTSKLEKFNSRERKTNLLQDLTYILVLLISVESKLLKLVQTKNRRWLTFLKYTFIYFN